MPVAPVKGEEVLALEEKTAAHTAATVRTAARARRVTKDTLALVLQEHPLKCEELCPFRSGSEFILCYTMSCFCCLWLLQLDRRAGTVNLST